METQLRPLGTTTQQLQKEVKDINRRLSDNTEKVTTVDILQDEMRRMIEVITQHAAVVH